MSLEFKPATRTGVIPILGMYGRSGSGKTYSALMFARGLAGPTGRLGIIDTENRRASLFADIIPGGYQVFNLDPPFSPERYAEAVDALQKNFDVGVIDSMTHEHDGEGGVLEMQEAELQRMAGEDFKRREACKMAAWIKPKSKHKAFVYKLLRSRIPLICCLRAQEKTHITKGDDGKTKVITDEFSSPIYDHRFIFELLANIETVTVGDKPGCGIIRKWSHPDILKCLPKPGDQISAAHGEALARWCASPGRAPSNGTPRPTSDRTNAVKELWSLTESVHQNSKENGKHALTVWLREEQFITAEETLENLSVDRLKEIILAINKKEAHA